MALVSVGSLIPVKSAILNVLSATLNADIIVVDSDIFSSNRIVVDWGETIDKDENTPSMDNITFMAKAGLGNVTINIRSLDQLFKGLFKINYIII